MNIDRTIAKLELKHMLENLLDTVDFPRNDAMAGAQNWTRKNLSSFSSCVKTLLPPCSRICFWVMRPSIYGTKTDLYELKDGYAVIKTLHAPDYDENEAEFSQSIDEHEFFHMFKRAIIYNLFFFLPKSSTAEHCSEDNLRSKNLEFTGLILQLLGVNT